MVRCERTLLKICAQTIWSMYLIYQNLAALVQNKLIVANSLEIIPVMALLDTGFTGWVAINNQDAESLGWTKEIDPQEMETAKGKEFFSLYQGNVLVDEEQFTVTVLGGDELENILLGVLWLKTKRLVVDFPAEILTLG